MEPIRTVTPRVSAPVISAAVTLVAFGVMGNLASAGPVETTLQPRMGDPVPGMTTLQMELFLAGKERYEHVFQPLEGLGPIFNKESCANCHANPVGGAGSQTVTRFGSLGKFGFDPLVGLGGPLLQASSISVECAEVMPPEANVETKRRTSGGAMGYGLIEAIADDDILAVRDAQPKEVQGVANMVVALESPTVERVGRFGWKAQLPTVLSFSADASLMEIGLTNILLNTENAPNGDLDLLAECDMVPVEPGAWEDQLDNEGFYFINRVTHFQRFLAPAPQTPKSGMTGEAIFDSIGCAVCHTPSFTTPDNPFLEEALRNKTIRPYSDFLLHNMGQAADNIWDGMATGQQIKTNPLAGFRRRQVIWHDGRIVGGTIADRVAQAVGLHGAFGSQAVGAAAAYDALSAEEKAQVVAFLDSLGRIEFDADGDNEVDIVDFHGFGDPAAFAQCYDEVATYTPDDPCAVHDVNQDGKVDMADFDLFLVAYEGEIEDCDGNGISDFEEILNGAADQEPINGVPDFCELCQADVNGTGVVDVLDLVAVIVSWGQCPVMGSCDGDIDGNGMVDVLDLVKVIVNWGPCQ